MSAFIYILLTASILSAIILFFLFLAALKSQQKLIVKIERHKDRFESYKKKMEPLKKYQVIQDAVAEAKQIEKNAKLILAKAQSDHDKKLNQAKSEATRIHSQAYSLRENIQSEYEKTIKEAKAIGQAELKKARAKADKILQNAHATNK